MNSSRVRGGLLGVADVASNLALIACLMGWAVLGMIFAMPPRDQPLSEQMERYWLTFVAVLTISALVVQVVGRAIRHQRRLIADQEEAAAAQAQRHEDILAGRAQILANQEQILVRQAQILADQHRAMAILGGQADAPAAEAEPAPSNVYTLFELGRKVGRADRAPTVLP